MCYETTNIFVLMPFRKPRPYYKQSSLVIVTVCKHCISNEFKKSCTWQLVWLKQNQIMHKHFEFLRCNRILRRVSLMFFLISYNADTSFVEFSKYGLHIVDHAIKW